MSESHLPEQPESERQIKETTSGSAGRVARYTFSKIITLFLSVTIGLYLTILVANLGGYIDKIYEGMIGEQILGMLRGGWLKGVPEEQKLQIIEQTTWQMEEEMGLHEAFLSRCWRWLYHGLTLDLGKTRYAYFPPSTSTLEVRDLIRYRLPYTLVLTGSANLLVFVVSVFMALHISRRYGNWLDKVMIALSPLSSAPSWVHGVFLILIFAAGLHVLPFPKEVDISMAEKPISYLPYLLKYMVLPFTAVFMGAFFQSVYAWRTYFLIYAGEDYVEMAKAKGLPAGRIERNYILKPTLPYLVTSFAMTVIGLWQGAIALEVLFYWQGIGSLFVQAVRRFDTTLIVGIVIIFAYMLAVTVFFLDIIYAVIDPRVRVGGGDQALRAARGREKRHLSHMWLRQHQEKEFIRGGLPVPVSPEAGQRGRTKNFKRRSANIKPVLQELLRYPSAIAGSLLILMLVGISIYAVATIPYDEAVSLWRREGNAYYQNPRTAPPVWTNLFRKDDLPTTLVMNNQEGVGVKTVDIVSDEMTKITISFPFEYTYNTFPQDLVLILTPKFTEKLPLVSLMWVRADGKEINLDQFTVAAGQQAYYLSQDDKLKRRLGEHPLEDALFADPESGKLNPIKGTYELRVTAFMFEEGADMDAEMVLYGQVYGLAGTDNMRRDLTVALLWGAPVALAFGLLGALVTSLFSMIIAAVGAWFGGWVDDLVQRITEVNMILPTLPIAIMVFTLYSKSIWAVLGVIILLSIFGSSVKNFRSAFLQMREAPYVEAAQAYGASNWRIILHYLVPRSLPILIPQLVIMVPGYVFYEATLAYLGLSDPYIPTWGKVIFDALTMGGFQGNYYWILEPIGLLLVTGLAFAMLGFALDRILNPRLRER